MIEKIYLDAHSATRPDPWIIDSFSSNLQEQWRTFSSLEALEKLKASLGAAKESTFVLTGSTGETMEQIFLANYIDVVRERGRNHLLTTPLEELPTLQAIKRFEELDCAAKWITLNEQGQVTKEALEEALNPRTALVSLSWANGLTGVVHPLADIAKVCKEKDVKLHVDASYVIGKLHFQLQDLGVDFFSFDGALLHAPRGISGFFRKGVSDIENLPALSALNEAVEQTLSRFESVCTETARLRDYFERGIRAGFKEAQILFETAERLPNCTAIAFPGVHAETLLYALQRQGIYASIGGGRFQKLSALLKTCGVEEPLCHSALSFSLSHDTTQEEVERAVEIIVATAKKQSGYSAQLFRGGR